MPKQITKAEESIIIIYSYLNSVN